MDCRGIRVGSVAWACPNSIYNIHSHKQRLHVLRRIVWSQSLSDPYCTVRLRSNLLDVLLGVPVAIPTPPFTCQGAPSVSQMCLACWSVPVVPVDGMGPGIDGQYGAPYQRQQSHVAWPGSGPLWVMSMDRESWRALQKKRACGARVVPCLSSPFLLFSSCRLLSVFVLVVVVVSSPNLFSIPAIRLPLAEHVGLFFFQLLRRNISLRIPVVVAEEPKISSVRIPQNKPTGTEIVRLTPPQRHAPCVAVPAATAYATSQFLQHQCPLPQFGQTYRVDRVASSSSTNLTFPVAACTCATVQLVW